MPDTPPIPKEGEATPLWHQDVNFQTIIPLFGHHFQAMKVRDDYVILAYRRSGKKKLRSYAEEIKRAGRIG
jgi:hypothetical protein